MRGRYLAVWDHHHPPVTRKSSPQGGEVRDADVVDVWKKAFPWGEVCLLLIAPQTNRSRIPSKSDLGNRVYWAYLQSMGECGDPQTVLPQNGLLIAAYLESPLVNLPQPT